MLTPLPLRSESLPEWEDFGNTDPLMVRTFQVRALVEMDLGSAPVQMAQQDTNDMNIYDFRVDVGMIVTATTSLPGCKPQTNH